MLLRRAALPLPLIVATAAVTAGCVTVRPAGPADPPRVTPRAAASPQPAAETWSLGPLPPAADPSPPAPADGPAAGPAAPAPSAARPGPDAPPRRPGGAVHPGPGAAPKPRTRPPAAGKPRTAPPPGYDMRSLCEAAKGTVDPAIVALCPY